MNSFRIMKSYDVYTRRNFTSYFMPEMRVRAVRMRMYASKKT